MLVTPRARKRADTDEKGAEGLAAIMSRVSQNNSDQE